MTIYYAGKPEDCPPYYTPLSELFSRDKMHGCSDSTSQKYLDRNFAARMLGSIAGLQPPFLDARSKRIKAKHHTETATLVTPLRIFESYL